MAEVDLSSKMSMLKEEAMKHSLHLDTLLKGGRLNEEQAQEFFSELPGKIGTTCEAAKIPGATEACVEAINFLHRWSKRNERKPISYVDRELVDTLKRVLHRISKGWGLSDAVVGSFNRTLTPRFTVEAAEQLSSMGDIRKDLVGQAMTDIKASALVTSSMWKATTS
ncbi:MAG: hypothetical protein ACYS0D_13540 [Planctomycetota bacterium]